MPAALGVYTVYMRIGQSDNPGKGEHLTAMGVAAEHEVHILRNVVGPSPGRVGKEDMDNILSRVVRGLGQRRGQPCAQGPLSQGWVVDAGHAQRGTGVEETTCILQNPDTGLLVKGERSVDSGIDLVIAQDCPNGKLSTQTAHEIQFPLQETGVVVEQVPPRYRPGPVRYARRGGRVPPDGRTKASIPDGDRKRRPGAAAPRLGPKGFHAGSRRNAPWPHTRRRPKQGRQGPPQPRTTPLAVRKQIAGKPVPSAGPPSPQRILFGRKTGKKGPRARYTSPTRSMSAPSAAANPAPRLPTTASGSKKGSTAGPRSRLGPKTPIAGRKDQKRRGASANRQGKKRPKTTSVTAPLSKRAARTRESVAKRVLPDGSRPQGPRFRPGPENVLHVVAVSRTNTAPRQVQN